MYTNASFQNHPFIRILQLEKPTKLNDKKLFPVLSILIQNIKFPRFSEEQLQAIYSKLIAMKDYGQILNDFDFGPPVPTDTLIVVLDIKTEDSNFITCLAFAVFRSVIYYVLTIEKNTQSMLGHVLSLLNFVAKGNHSQLVHDTFLYVYQLTQKFNIKRATHETIGHFQQFFQLFPKSTNALFLVVEQFQQTYSDPNLPLDTEAAEKLLFISQIIADDPEIMNLQISSTIVTMLLSHMYKFDIVTLTFFHRICSLLHDNEKTPIFGQFANALIAYYQDNQPFIKGGEIPDDIEPVKVVIHQQKSMSFNFPEKSIFKDSTQMLNNIIDYPSKLLFKDVCPRSLAVALDIVSKCAIECPDHEQQLFNNFYTLIQKDIHTPNYFSEISSFITILLKIKDDIAFNMYFKIFETPIFNPAITVFSEGKDKYEDLFSVRWIITTSIIKANPTMIKDVILAKLEYPYLVGEFFLILVSFFNNIPASFFASKDFFELTSEVISKYQRANIEYIEDEQQTKAIETARAYSIIFFTTSLQTHPISDYCNPQRFLQSIFSLIYEPGLRDYIFNRLQCIWISAQNVAIDFLIPYILSFLESSTLMFDKDDRYLSLSVDLLRWIAMILNNDIIESSNFLTFMPTIFKSLHCLSDLESTVQYISVIIKFLTFTYSQAQIEDTDLEWLFTIIKKYFGEDIPDAIFLDIMKIISARDLQSQEPRFFIKHPRVLFHLIKISIGTSKLISMLKYVNELCLYSISNRIMCHDGQIDILVLDILYECRVELEDGSIIPVALQLLNQISSFAASTPVVQRYISLFTPIKARYLSSLHSIFIASLCDLIQERHKYPSEWYPFTYNAPIITVNGIHLQGKDYTVGMWLYMDKTNNYTSFRLFTLSDDKKCTVCVSFSRMQLIIQIKDQNGNNQYENSLTLKTPNNWFFISFQFDSSQQLPACHIAIDGSIIKSLILTPYEFDKGSLTLQYGGESDSRMPTALGGSFGIFDTIDQYKVNQIVMNGPNRFDSIPSICTVSLATSREGFLSVNCSENYTAKLEGRPIIHLYTFIEVMIQYCKVHVILPLFAQLDFQYHEEGKDSSFACAILNLLSLALLYSKEGQKNFTQSKGFCILSYLLLTASPKHITFPLYQKFIQIYESLDDEELMTQLMQTIILNFEIWSRGTSKVILWITQKFVKFVQKHIEKIVEAIPFSTLLTSFKKFFYQESVNEYKEIQESRTNMLELFAKYAEISFDDNSFEMIINVCLNSNDQTHFVNDLLTLLKMLVNLENSPLAKLTNSWKMFMYLQPLFITANIDIIITLLELYGALHHKGYIKSMKLEHHVQLMMEMTPESLPKSEFFDRMINIISDNPEYLPYYFKQHFVQGTEWNHIKANKSFSTHPLWAWQPIKSALSENNSKVMIFLAYCTKDEWKTIYCLIDIAGQLLNVDSSDAKYTYLTAMCIIISADPNITPDQVSSFFDIAIHFIFLKQSSFNQALLNQMKAREPTSKTENVFGLRFNEAGKWLDADLAINLARLALKTKISVLHNYAGLLTYFTKRYFKDQSNQIIGEIQKEKLANDSFINIASSYEVIENFVADFAKNRIPDLMNNITLCNKLIKEFDEEVLRIKQANLFNCPTEIASIEPYTSPDYKKLWNRLWYQLSLDLAPWQNSVAAGDKHWQRDTCYCSYFCQLNMKQNLHFDDHKYASLCRDTGSQKSAQTKLEQDKLLLLEQYEETRPPVVLELSYDNEKDVNENNIETIEEDVKFSDDAVYIKATGKRKCKFIVYRTMIQIVFNDNKPAKHISAKNTKYIFFRQILHLPTGLEIFTVDRNSYLINLVNYNSLPVLQMISRMNTWQNSLIQKTMPAQFVQENRLTKKWKRGKISNFEYLMRLNVLSGRSFNEPAMYPVLPWVISKYETDELNLEDPDYFRDLTKPMGQMSEKRYKYLQDRMIEMSKFNHTSCLYSCGFSSSLTIYLFLLRMEPFATLHIEAQSGRFDHATRLFVSIPEAYQFACENVNDYRELPPEFYCQPQFLLNSNHFDLGHNGRMKVDDVVLPKWASSPLDFIYKNRKALESNYVSENINSWIDLMWGCRQKDGCNKFQYTMYEDAWNSKTLNDPMQRAEIEAMKQNCGQIPTQLFSTPHPKREVKEPLSFVQSPYSLPTNKNNIVFSEVTRYDKDTIIICLIDNVGKLIKVQVSTDNSGKKVCQSSEINNFGSSGFVNEQIVLSSNNEIMVTTNFGAVRTFDFNGKEDWIFGHTGKVTCICANDKYFVTGGNDTLINIFENNEKHQLIINIPSYREQITCCAVNTPFSLVASATIDGSLFLISLSSQSTQQILSLGNVKPNLVLITYSWGFIIVYETEMKDGKITHYLQLIQNDGTLVKKQEIECGIKTWFTWTSRKSFDYVVFVGDNNTIYVFESFYLDVTKVYKCQTKIIAVKMLIHLNTIVATTENGELYFIPYYV